jgi:hypothetical protein
MDPARFDRLAVSISRRTTRRAAIGALVGLGASRLASPSDGAAASCLDDGARCRPSDPLPCCSGWCKGKRGSRKKTCKSGPNRGVCTVVNDFCALTGDIGCGNPDCFCFRRPNGASVCASIAGGIYPDKMCSFAGSKCSDKACRVALGDKRAFCVLNGDGCCGAGKTGACVLPCATLDA